MAENQREANPTSIEGAVGASDADNGGGAGAGVPDAELVARAGDAVTRGDVHADREKLFPEAKSHEHKPGADAGDVNEQR